MAVLNSSEIARKTPINGEKQHFIPTAPNLHEDEDIQYSQEQEQNEKPAHTAYVLTPGEDPYEKCSETPVWIFLVKFR